MQFHSSSVEIQAFLLFIYRRLSPTHLLTWRRCHLISLYKCITNVGFWLGKQSSFPIFLECCREFCWIGAVSTQKGLLNILTQCLTFVALSIVLVHGNFRGPTSLHALVSTENLFVLDSTLKYLRSSRIKSIEWHVWNNVQMQLEMHTYIYERDCGVDSAEIGAIST